jgi:carboxyl-terminal processing protease
VRDGVIVVTKGRNRSEEIARATPENALPDFPMVVLVNEHSASASEIVAGSLMDNHRALVIGTRTYGKGSVQEVIPMEGGGELKLTVAYYYLPSGRLVHRRKDATDWGVDPQIIVPMSDEAERGVVREQSERELFRRLAPKDTTRPSTNPAALRPASQPADVQLEAAISTMVGHVILSNEGAPGAATAPMPAPVVALPSTRPAAATQSEP